MPIKSTTEYIEMSKSGKKTLRLNYADLPPGSDRKKADYIKEQFQALHDTRIPLADLPDGSDPLIGDEPARTVNPDRPDFFWGDENGIAHPEVPILNTHLIARDWIETDCRWDGERFVTSGRRAEQRKN